MLDNFFYGIIISATVSSARVRTLTFLELELELNNAKRTGRDAKTHDTQDAVPHLSTPVCAGTP